MYYQVALKPDSNLKRMGLFRLVQSFKGTSFIAADVDHVIWS